MNNSIRPLRPEASRMTRHICVGHIVVASGVIKASGRPSVSQSFVHYKGNFNRQHQFAIFTLGATTRCRLPFTSDLDHVQDALASLETDPEASEAYVMDELFDALLPLVGPTTDPATVKYLTRAILIFGRSHALPELHDPSPIFTRDTFFMDVLYVHKNPQEPGTMCQDIFDFLTAFDGKNPLFQKDYYLDIATHSTKLLLYVQMLMAHPIQRFDQDSFLEKVEFVPPSAPPPPQMLPPATTPGAFQHFYHR
jgi:hypothetical protein